MATKKTQQTFSSIGAFSRHVAGLMDKTGKYGNTSRQGKEYKWDMNMNLPEALDVGLAGGRWLEGAQNLQSVDVVQEARNIAEGINPVIEHDVTGGFLDVGEYMANQSPEVFMRVDEEALEAKPVIKIGVCSMPCWRVSANAFMNRGRAVLALCDALEMQGYSVEIISSCNHHEGNQIHIADITVKEAGQSWDAASAAFALAHPAFSRRLGFKNMEHCEAAWMTASGYGMGTQENPSDYDLYVPYLLRDDPVKTPADAIEYMKQLVKDQKPEMVL